MSTKDTLEKMARNTWLAGLGSIDSSKEALSKSIDAAQEKSNNLYNELLTRGEGIQSKINDARDEIHSKGKKILGLGSEKSEQEKLDQLTAIVDNLTNVVTGLIEKRNAEASAAKEPVEKAAAAKATAKAKTTAVKTTPKATKTTDTSKKTAKTVSKTATKK